jgi:hypothetical protein
MLCSRTMLSLCLHAGTKQSDRTWIGPGHAEIKVILLPITPEQAYTDYWLLPTPLLDHHSSPVLT